MKKSLLTLLISILIGSICACGGSQNSNTGNAADQKKNTNTAATIETEVVEAEYYDECSVIEKVDSVIKTAILKEYDEQRQSYIYLLGTDKENAANDAKMYLTTISSVNGIELYADTQSDQYDLYAVKYNSSIIGGVAFDYQNNECIIMIVFSEE